MIDIGYLLGCLCEYLVFMYFANTNLKSGNINIKSNLIILIGYVVIWISGLWNNSPAAICTFLIVNVVIIRCVFRIPIKNAVFYGLILEALSVLGEYIFSYFFGVRVQSVREDFTMQQALTIVVGGKLTYLMGVLLLNKFIKHKAAQSGETSLSLLIIPLLTTACVILLRNAEIDYKLFLPICIAFLLMNVTMFYVYARITEKNQQLKLLQQEREKNMAELGEYRLLAEKYENTKIMRHDFHKQLAVLSNLISEDNEKAKKYMQELQFMQRELDYTQYTDNNILNVIFAQKIQECHNKGIEIHIHSTSPTLSFISDIDTVAIFSNLIDNAIEASADTKVKEIFVDLYTVNGSFAAVKVENNADQEPIVLDGLLRTQKDNPNEHGLGIKSINNSLKKYNSSLDWAYDRENKFFRAMVLVHIPQE